jgi:uncharacterized protein YjiK
MTRLPGQILCNGLTLFCMLAVMGCTRRSEPGLPRGEDPALRKSNGETYTGELWLPRYDLGDEAAQSFPLPLRLSELSGLAMSADGRLFAHDDEQGVVYQLDYSSGSVVKKFSLGRITVSADFEGIAVAGPRMFLATSSGTIFSFVEAENNQRVSFDVYKTPLSESNDVEGLEYDRDSNALLLACKGYPGKNLTGYRAVYSFSLDTHRLTPVPRMIISVRDIRGGESFNPSGIARHPVSGTYFILSADAGAIIETDRDGAVLAQRTLPESLNRQPEGISFAPDTSLIICNDGQGKTGTLNVYPLAR